MTPDQALNIILTLACVAVVLGLAFIILAVGLLISWIRSLRS